MPIPDPYAPAPTMSLPGPSRKRDAGGPAAHREVPGFLIPCPAPRLLPPLRSFDLSTPGPGYVSSDSMHNMLRDLQSGCPIRSCRFNCTPADERRGVVRRRGGPSYSFHDKSTVGAVPAENRRPGPSQGNSPPRGRFRGIPLRGSVPDVPGRGRRAVPDPCSFP
jgi:hypothetical protein